MIVRYPNSILKEKCAPVDPTSAEARKIVSDLRAEAKTVVRQSIGLSAPQIGVTKRIFVMDTKILGLKGSGVFINPEIIESSEETGVMKEECMSFPRGVGVKIRRPVKIKLDAFDEQGFEFSVELTGLAARCAQHEIDHLNGISILDHATKHEKRLAIQKITIDIKRRNK